MSTDDRTPQERLDDLLDKVTDATEAVNAAASSETDRSALVAIEGQNLPAVAMKAQMATKRAEMLRAEKRLREAQAEVKAEIDRQRDAMEAQLRAAMAELEPIREKVAQMEEGIWTANLYLGRDEYIEQIAEGKPGTVDDPIHVRQTVLFMDEESVALADEGGLDFTNIGLFLDWLRVPANRDLMIPETKCVVAIKPRRTEIDYGNPWESAQKNRANVATWFVIRNGENLYLLSTDDDDRFKVGARLVPTRDEFTRVFRVEDRRTGQVRTMEPGTEEWMKAEKRAAARERHYMRVAMVLQGLIDRTATLAPVAPGTSLLSPQSYNDGSVVLVADEEMALTTGRESFADWQARLNANLRPGIRIVGRFNTSAFEDANDSYSERRYDSPHSRLSPGRAEYPPSKVIHVLDGRRGDGFVFKYTRERESYIGDSGWGYGGEYRKPKTRASCVVKASDKFILALDLATIEEMETYLAARTERHAYADMLPVLQAAIAAKHAEHEAEAPFRDLAARTIAAERDVDPDTLTDEIADLVHWWKHSNVHHRPLVLDDAAPAKGSHEGKAMRMIVAEAARRVTDAGRVDEPAEAAAVARLRTAHPRLMYIGRNRQGKIVGFEPQPRAYRGAYKVNPYVVEHTTGLTDRSTTTSREWVLPGVRHTRMRDLWVDHDRWDTWDRAAVASKAITDADIARLSDEATRIIMARVHDGRRDRLGRAYVDPNPHARLLAVSWGRFERWYAGVVSGAPQVQVHVAPGIADKRGRVEHTTYRLAAAWDATAKRFEMVRDEDGLVSISEQTKVWPSTKTFGPDDPAKRPWRHPVVEDADAIAAHLRLRVEAEAQSEARRARANEVRSIERRIEGVWLDRYWAERKARFVEDYADESLWEDHRKSQKAPSFPHDRHNFGRYVFIGHEAVKALHAAHVDMVGMRVDEIVALAAAEHDVPAIEVPGDLADIVVPPLPSGEDVED